MVDNRYYIGILPVKGGIRVTERQTEAIHPDAIGLDTLPDEQVLARYLSGHIAALHCVENALPDLAKAAALVAETLRGDGRLVYAGAGSSALMACADGLELAGTFGTSPDRVVLLMAGGLPQDSEMPGGTEDATTLADADASRIRPGDTVITVAASGSTPYALRIAEKAQALGAKTICIANTPGAPLFDHADVAVCLPTPPEMVAGSTRLGAGTAQKVALNMMSTLMGLRLGHIHDGMMVNLRADNAKLKDRASRIVQEITGAAEPDAHAALPRAGGAVKPAILLLSGAASPAQADQLLTQHQGQLRATLDALADPETA